jgi:hypothetical protein
MAWAATEAKAKFSEVLNKAETEGPQIVRRRKQEYLIMTKEEHEASPKVAKLLQQSSPVPKKYRNLAEFFRNSPLADSGADLDRVKLKPRHIEF